MTVVFNPLAPGSGTGRHKSPGTNPCPPLHPFCATLPVQDIFQPVLCAPAAEKPVGFADH